MDLFGPQSAQEKSKAKKAKAHPAESSGIEAPLASRMRPRTLEEFVGQAHILGEGKLLRRIILSDRLTSLILYGPPGSGKTTLALIISRMTGARFKNLNAVASNVQDLRVIIDEAKYLKQEKSQRTILFIDEIHRFNKAQQDVLMPDVEEGNLILIGSTTHNPSFSINGPLLSRSMMIADALVDDSVVSFEAECELEDDDDGPNAR